MVLESTMVCVDNSDYMRNGDFIPTRLQAQQDAVSLVCHSKARSNPENNVGLVVMSSVEVLATLTSEVGRILSKLHQVQPKGEIAFITAVRVAHLALKHRQGRNHKLRIVVFVGSPVQDDEKELVKLAKKLKKEKVNVDVVNFGEEGVNTDKLTTFINTINGKEGTSSNLVTVSPGPMLSDALLSSPVVMGEDGTGVVAGMGGSFEFGVDPNEDPELALALRVSMEEQRARQEEEARKVAASTTETTPAATGGTLEEESLEQAIAMSLNPEAEKMEGVKDYSEMTEEEQIALALQMSMQNPVEESSGATPMETDEEKKPKEEKKPEDEDFLNDPAFLQSVLSNLPGVDPQSEAIRNAMSSLTDKSTPDKKDDTKKDDKSKDKK